MMILLNVMNIMPIVWIFAMAYDQINIIMYFTACHTTKKEGFMSEKSIKHLEILAKTKEKKILQCVAVK